MLNYSKSKREYKVDPNNLAGMWIGMENLWTAGIHQDVVIIHILALSF